MTARSMSRILDEPDDDNGGESVVTLGRTTSFVFTHTNSTMGRKVKEIDTIKRNGCFENSDMLSISPPLANGG